MFRYAGCLGCLGVLMATSLAQAGGGWSVGVRFGGPYYEPHCHHHCYGPAVYYRPYPLYYAPPPVIVVPAAPAVVAVPARAPAVSLSAPQLPPPTPENDAPQNNNTLPVPTVSRGAAYDLPALNDPSPDARADAILSLGRRRDRQAVAPITRALREDGSPAVRDAAARALGLIALPASLEALQRAAQSDPDRDVRKSASFAADVIRANLRQ